jgi:hypothetical protein
MGICLAIKNLTIAGVVKEDLPRIFSKGRAEMIGKVCEVDLMAAGVKTGSGSLSF